MTILKFPARGWCVRAGTRCAHYFFLNCRRQESACRNVERLDLYMPQRLRPRQVAKPRCLACEQNLRKVATG